MATRKKTGRSNASRNLLDLLQKNDKILMLIDGTSLAYRAFFAFAKNPLRNSKGENTSAPFGFTNSIIKLLNDFNPSHIAVVFDAKGPTFRHESFKSYKANRPQMPAELSIGLRRIKEIADALGIKTFEVPGVEADDVIATIARKAVEDGFKVILVTSDKDMLQLVNESVIAVDTRPKDTVVYDRKAVEDKFGVPPELIPDYLALSGDSIDNIPGVPGIGPKTAKELIQQFGSLEDIYRNLNSIKRTSTRRSLELHRDKAFGSKTLTVLKKDVPIEIDWDEFKRREPERARLFAIFRDLEFTSLMKQVASQPPKVEIVKADDFKPKDGFAVAVRDRSFLVAEAESSKILNIPVKSAHSDDLFSSAKPLPDGLVSALGDPDRKKWVFSAKELHRKGIEEKFEVQGIEFDMSIAAYLVDPAKPGYDLERLALEYAGFKLHDDPLLRGADELLVVLETREMLLDELEENELGRLYREIELPLTKVLAYMEHYGVPVDIKFLKELGVEIERKIEDVRKKIFEIAGEPFNLNSPRQLAHILFEKLGLPPIKRTKTGYSTNAEVLAKLAMQHELPKLILEYRELFKVKSTYIDALIQSVNPDTGRIHPTFHQTGTVTGRLSCSDPNLQNIPIRSDIGRELRRAFAAPRGKFIVSADYSQIELRLLAHITGDENLIRAFKEGADIHAATASAIFGKPPEMVDSLERRKAKVVNFGITYGMSPFGLAKELNISPEEAALIIFNYFATYPGVQKWIEKTLEQARIKGYVTTIFGRRRYIPELNVPNRQVREMAERTAINAPIQGSAADIIKKAMVGVQEAILSQKLSSMMILQIHDELLFEVPESEIETMKRLIREIMENVVQLKVPLVVDIGVGRNWLEAHE